MKLRKRKELTKRNTHGSETPREQLGWVLKEIGEEEYLGRAGNQRNIVTIELAGFRSGTDGDFHRANIEAGFPNVGTPTGPNGEPMTWHHMDDFDPSTGRATMQLVYRNIHQQAIPHTGSPKQYSNYHNSGTYGN